MRKTSRFQPKNESENRGHLEELHLQRSKLMGQNVKQFDPETTLQEGGGGTLGSAITDEGAQQSVNSTPENPFCRCINPVEYEHL